jgi:hypothetical protein
MRMATMPVERCGLLDGAYNTDFDQLDVNINLTNGTYSAVVQAWDNPGDDPNASVDGIAVTRLEGTILAVGPESSSGPIDIYQNFC